MRQHYDPAARQRHVSPPRWLVLLALAVIAAALLGWPIFTLLGVST